MKHFSLWKLLKLPPQLLYAVGLGPVYGRLVLLLTTTGRVSGKERVTPLQYEEIDGEIYVASARGVRADWYRNIAANPQVTVRYKGRQFTGLAEPTTDPVRIADFLDIRLKRHPRMIGMLLRREGLVKNPSRTELEDFAANKAMVIIRPPSTD
jgi:deazaflavin-dependent oxidoreductase (nitroreductase family)